MATIKNRIYYLDVIRVVACLAVIMIHSSAIYVDNNIGSLNFWVGNILNGISRVGVPLFVMISGALLLDKDYNYSNKKPFNHITKLIIFFVFWSFIYCVIFRIIEPALIKHESVNIVEVVGSLIKGHYHLWYIYMIIGLYLILPLMRLWIKDENKKYVEYFIILSIIFNYIIPQIISVGKNYTDLFNHVQNILDYINLKYVGGFTTYFVLGWYINNYSFKKRKIIYMTGILSAITTILGTYIIFITSGKVTHIGGYLTINVFLQTVAIFLCIKTKFNNIKENKSKFISIISKNSLGIYAIHAGIVSIAYDLLLNRGFNVAIINIPIVFIISLMGSVLITYMLEKIPILKKVI